MRFLRCASAFTHISASASGFAIAEANQITISVGARERIDLVLKVGTAQATTVEVSDVALQLQTESSQRDQTITNYQTQSLPLVSRNYSDLRGLRGWRAHGATRPTPPPLRSPRLRAPAPSTSTASAACSTTS